MLAAGTCNEASCDCVEWFHQAALIYVGATPGWYGKEMPRTQTAMKDMLSTEFKTMMDEGKIITEKEQVKLSANPLASLHTKRLVPNCKCVTATVCKIPDDSFGLPRWTVLTDQGPVIQGPLQGPLQGPAPRRWVTWRCAAAWWWLAFNFASTSFNFASTSEPTPLIRESDP